MPLLNGAFAFGDGDSTNMPRRRRWGKAPEGWSTPRRSAPAWVVDNRASVLECGSSLPLWHQGDNFSRCGRWSRFQRAKAASLVSANRNCSVGDSTWLSQKTTLALLALGKSSRGLEHRMRNKTAATVARSGLVKICLNAWLSSTRK